MRLKTRVSLSLSSTTAEEMDVANVAPSSYEITDALSEGSSRTYKVAHGVSAQAVDLAGLSAVNLIYVRTNRAVTFHITSPAGTENIPVAVPTGNENGHLLLNTAGVTSLAISNSSGGTARVMVVLAGDEE
jgi:hypothetical protein